MKIAESNQFPLHVKNVTHILARYDLALRNFNAASTGIENTTLIIDTNKGKFVLRVYRQRKKDSTEIYRELDFMEYLRANNIKVPRVISNTQGERLTLERLDDKVWQVIVMEFIEGRHAQTYTPELIIELSSTQANMHNLSSSYADKHGVLEPLTNLEENYFIDQILQERIDRQLQAFLQRAKAYELNLPLELPKGLCHLDYDTDNALVSKNSVAAILDFDDLALAPFIVCLGYTLWHVRTEAGEEAAQKYLENYETQRKLSDLERQFIKPVMLFRHYVISSVKILNGHTSPEDIMAFLKQESVLT